MVAAEKFRENQQLESHYAVGKESYFTDEDIETLFRWFDQLYGIDFNHLPRMVFAENIYESSRVVVDENTGEKLKFYLSDYEGDVDKMIGASRREVERLEAAGHRVKSTSQVDDRLIEYIRRKREEAHLL